MKKLLLLISVACFAAACTSDSEEDLIDAEPDRCSTTISFQDEISAIINTNCAIPGCHNGDIGASRDWTVFANVQNSAQAIRSRTFGRTMPPPNSGITLSDAQIDAISCWVEQGANNN
ncbi:MAG: 2-polyprenyl-6-methoxyphenol hydroxylase [Bacteroidota bacterium]